jgi:hypothetical protein
MQVLYLSHFHRGENEEIGSGFPWEKKESGVMHSPKEPSLTTIFGWGRWGAYVSKGGFRVNI